MESSQLEFYSEGSDMERYPVEKMYVLGSGRGLCADYISTYSQSSSNPELRRLGSKSPHPRCRDTQHLLAEGVQRENTIMSVPVACVAQSPWQAFCP